MIRTGILCVPAYDEEAVKAVRGVMRAGVPDSVVVLDRHVTRQRYVVEEVLRRWSDEEELDLILTVGGTLPAPGPSSRETVPAATLAVAERQLPGIAETMRAYALEETPLALLDCGVSVIRGRTLIVNLPAGAGPAAFFLECVTDVLGAVVAHLRDEPSAPLLADALAGADPSSAVESTAQTPDEPPGAASARPAGLDAGEFAAFLKQRKQGNEP